MRIAVFTPLAPQRSGIAAYCAALLPAMAEHVSVTVVVEDSKVSSVAPMEGVAVVALADYIRRRDDWDVAVYHMGNHAGAHHWIYRELLQRPGVTVLHDLNLTAFFDHMATLAPSLPRPGGGGLGSLSTVVECSRTVIVHGESQADVVAQRFPAATVIACDLAGVPVPPADSDAVLRACGWDSELFVVGAFGGIARHKRIDLAIRAIAALHPHQPSLRLLISGWVFDDDYLTELEQLVTRLGVNNLVRIVTDTDSRELASCLLAVDVVIDLRDDVTGAMSATVMNALASGRSVIVPDLPMYARLDVPGVMRVGLSATEAVVDATDLLRECLRDRLANRRRGEAAARWVDAGSANVRAVAARHAQFVTLARQLPDPPSPFVPVVRPLPVRRDVVGELTVVGDFTATTGLMEYARSLANVLDEAGVPLDHHFNPCLGAAHSDARDVRGLARRLPRRREADVELWLPNINEFVDISETTLRPDGSRRKIIAVWAWELPVLRAPFVDQIARVDEIWVGSPFVARLMQRHTTVPVVVIPVPIQVDFPAGLSRSHFGLNDGDTIFFFDFDGNSTAARKNPFSLIEAFRRAFADGTADIATQGTPRLVIKGTNFHADPHRRLGSDLREQLASVGGVFVDSELDRGHLNALLACADVYVSLHRSEGLGLGMLEAMYLGKPVISPAYPEKWLFRLADVGCAIARKQAAPSTTSTAC